MFKLATVYAIIFAAELRDIEALYNISVCKLVCMTFTFFNRQPISYVQPLVPLSYFFLPSFHFFIHFVILIADLYTFLFLVSILDFNHPAYKQKCLHNFDCRIGFIWLSEHLHACETYAYWI